MTWADAALLVGTGATIIGTLYSARAYHLARRQINPTTTQRNYIWMMAALTLLCWSAIGFDYYDRQHTQRPARAFALQWGLTPPHTFFIIVDASALADYASTSKLALIVRIAFANIDKMTDTSIGKSSTYTIRNEAVTMAVVAPILRFVPDVPNQVEYNVAIIPNRISMEQIRTLADVEALGGKLVSDVGKADVFRLTP